MLTKLCPRCGKRYPATGACSCRGNRHKDYDKYHRSKLGRLVYHSRDWAAVAKAVRQRAAGLDEYAFAVDHKVTMGYVAHHIVPLAEAPERAYDLGNLIYVSTRTHAMIHQEYDKSPEDKRAMQMTLFAIRGPGQKSFEV